MTSVYRSSAGGSHESSIESSDESSYEGSYETSDESLDESPRWTSHWSADKSEECVCYPFIPKAYRVVEPLGQGTFGTVFRCLKPGTDEEVAVKAANGSFSHLKHEAKIMRTLMSENLDEANIIKYHGELYVDNQLSLEFEILDESFESALNDMDEMMTLEEISSVIQQLAVALDGLKKVGVIHADLKLDNIMMVDKIKQPFKIKLIDFGVGLFTHKAKTGTLLQVPEFRAPEIFFGLPFSEAIDVWSLGIIMGYILIMKDPFTGEGNDKILHTLINLLGLPPTHLLDAGIRTTQFFMKNGDSWTLKHKKCREEGKQPLNESQHEAHSLDDLIRQRQGVEDDPDELRECLDLLKAMLQWDVNERITPVGILNHPFITRSSAKNRSPSNQTPEGSGHSLGTNCDETPEGLKLSPVSCDKTPGSKEPSPVSCDETPGSKETSPISCDETPESCKTRQNNSNSSETPGTIHRAPALTNGCVVHSHPELMIIELGEEEKPIKERNCFVRFCSWMKKAFICGAS